MTGLVAVVVLIVVVVVVVVVVGGGGGGGIENKQSDFVFRCHPLQLNPMKRCWWSMP